MGRPEQRLYASLLRLARRFAGHRLPLLGVAGSELACPDLCWRGALKAAFQAPRPDGSGLAEGARLLLMLQRQLETLLQAEEHTREALAEWADLAERWAPLGPKGGTPSNSTTSQISSSSSSSSSSSGSSSSGGGGSGSGSAASVAAKPLPGSPFAAAAAAEEGLALLTRQSQQLADPLFFLEAELEAEQAGSGGSSADEQAVSLDDLAAAVRRQHPSLFGKAGSSSSPERQLQGQPQDVAAQSAALADALYWHQRFRYEPFEWVYEGLSPLLLPPRLARRKLSPLTLAVLAGGVARRLGLPLAPWPADAGEEIAASVAEGPAGGAAAAGGLPLERLRPDVAQRYAGRASAAAPPAGPWVLVPAVGSPSADGEGGGLGRQDGLLMDACTGELLGPAEARQRHPGLRLPPDWQQRAPLVAWQHMVRTIIQAHQRRGESDLVAHWMYVLLALDPQAPEWDHMLAAGPV